ncbi:hypothetical protein ACUNME_003243 [Vibrio cholerae]|jgi:hypothetical protein|uniref:Putative phage-related protein n=1 Tax=Vibrio phage VP882 TaxID=2913982 RepID=A2I301_9CAUD|nr:MULTISPECIES: hypothetical protein [Gammaproteobacteria]YP_001039862.1 putative phage-related protein [Vibrio phage VP882]ELN1085007.1 hypothetical protein [Salmonella enterica]ABM73415.1 putative phage-related protein [Vibrio phage VP882]MCF9733021.1 hypothetical protein [Vibrio parahaemolyticus]MCF9748034.1 hypothetical protein [Vibrio parahaemolyticus]MCF9901273.1 hypothetical protein [Vibrio parahaemolyticus]
MSAHDYNTVRGLKLSQVPTNEHYKRLVRQYAQIHCHGFMRDALLKLAA